MKFLFYTLITALLTSCASYKSNQKYTIKEKVSYGPHKRQVGDLYLSKNLNAPLVITVHGGGWDSRDNSDFSSIAQSIATHGYNVFNINYRLAPKHVHPAPIDDLERAIKFLKKNYGNQFDKNRIALWGYSAGAQITFLYAFKRDKNIKAVVGGGGPYDFTWWPTSPIITPYMGYKHDENIKGWMSASPFHNLNKDAPAIFMYHGIKDNLVEHSQMTALRSKAKLLGLDIETHSVPFWGHAFTFVFSDEAVEKAIEFLKKRLDSKSKLK